MGLNELPASSQTIVCHRPSGHLNSPPPNQSGSRGALLIPTSGCMDVRSDVRADFPTDALTDILTDIRTDVLVCMSVRTSLRTLCPYGRPETSLYGCPYGSPCTGILTDVRTKVQPDETGLPNNQSAAPCMATGDMLGFVEHMMLLHTIGVIRGCPSRLSSR